MSVTDLYRRIGQLELELHEQRLLNQSLAERCHGQAEALGRKAEKDAVRVFVLPEPAIPGREFGFPGPCVVNGRLVPARCWLRADADEDGSWTFSLIGDLSQLCAPAKMG